jgi:hypothetical protein
LSAKPAKQPKIRLQKAADFLENIGIAIRTIGDQGQLHVGILYKIEDEPATVLHFTEPYHLKDDAPSEHFRWVEVRACEPITAKIVAGLCRLISDENKVRPMKIPYGYSYAGTYFNHDGTFVNRGLIYGLTCTSFVLAVFQTLFIDLLRIEEWPPFDLDDADWQMKMMNLYKPIYPENADALGSQVGAARFRPEHATAGAASKDAPLGYAAAQTLGAQIVQDLHRSLKAA